MNEKIKAVKMPENPPVINEQYIHKLSKQNNGSFLAQCKQASCLFYLASDCYLDYFWRDRPTQIGRTALFAFKLAASDIYSNTVRVSNNNQSVFNGSLSKHLVIISWDLRVF